VHVIDLHRLGHHPWTRMFWQIKDLAQLLYSSDIEGIEDRDRLRFWTTYLGAGRPGLARRILRWCILFKWRRYRRHNLKRLRRMEAGERAAPMPAHLGANVPRSPRGAA
jgi:heptose I phosphotransferase